MPNIGALAITEHDPTALARLFRAEVATIADMGCPPSPDSTVGKVKISFFGQSIRKSFFGRSRRVSPRSLVISPHHRAMWHLRPLSFCAESLETLMTHCPDPACGAELTWHRASAPFECDNCGADLREHPQPIVDCEDPEALSFMTELISPDPTARSRSEGMIPPGLSTCTPGDLFEFALMLAGVSEAVVGSKGTTWRRLWSDADFHRLTPIKLARAARTLLRWPIGFHEMADRIRGEAGARVNRSYGTLKELGALLSLARDPLLPSRPAAILNAEIEANMKQADVVLRSGAMRTSTEWITMSEVTKAFGLGGGVVYRLSRRDDVIVVRGPRHSPVLLRRSQMAEIVEQDRASMRLADVEKRLGLTSTQLRSLVEIGLLAWISGPAEELGTKRRRLSGASVTAFEASVLNAVPVLKDAPAAWTRLVRALASARLVPYEISLVIRGILDRRFAAIMQRCDESRPLLMRIYVREVGSEVTEKLAGGVNDGVGQADDVMLIGAASRYLGLDTKQFSRLRAAGWFPMVKARNAAGQVPIHDLKAFREKFMFTWEVKKLAGDNPSFRLRTLRNMGIEPTMIDGRKFLIWDRKAVTRALSSRM